MPWLANIPKVFSHLKEKERKKATSAHFKMASNKHCEDISYSTQIMSPEPPILLVALKEKIVLGAKQVRELKDYHS